MTLTLALLRVILDVDWHITDGLSDRVHDISDNIASSARHWPPMCNVAPLPFYSAFDEPRAPGKGQARRASQERLREEEDKAVIRVYMSLDETINS